MVFKQKEFNEFAREKKVAGYYARPIELSSGRISHVYYNWRDVSNDIFDLETLSRHVLNFVDDRNLSPDCFFGVPEGATKLAFMTNYLWANRSLATLENYVLPMGRGKVKLHGEPKDRYFIGEPRGNTIILEDVTTTGSSLLEWIANLRELNGVNVIAAISLTNRMELTPISGKDEQKIIDAFAITYERATGKSYDQAMSVKEAISHTGIPFYWVSTGQELLANINIPKNIVREI